MDEILKGVCEILRECGRMILEADRSGMHIDAKSGTANFVTEYDEKVQRRLRQGLTRLLPGSQFIGEEGEQTALESRGSCFIVDPIDGTTNFIKDYHMSSISVALLVDGTAELGVIYNPYLDEMYWAKRGGGAYCNGSPIHVSTQPLSNGIVLFGTSPYSQELAEKSFKMAYEYFLQALDIRRSGSAALDLCAIAAGRAELYFELTLSPWDYAAGALIVTEAGGTVTTVDGQPITYDRPNSILASNR